MMKAPASQHIRSCRSAWTAIALCMLTAGQAGLAAGQARAADPEAGKVRLADGKLQLTVPETWVRKKPDNRVIEHEFAVPAAAQDDAEGRVTITGAGGNIEANIDRWIGQFSQPDEGNTKDRAKIRKEKVAGEEVHLVDISGTFKDSRGPFSGTPAVEHKQYRMLAAIITSKQQGNYFVKFTGPQRTVADNEKAFQTMIDGLERK